MKKLILALLIILLLLTTLSVMTACSKDEDGVDGPMVKDAYGHLRREGSWLSECLILPELLSAEQLFGTGGESGLVSEKALEMDGKIGADGSGYLICLVYGNVAHSERMSGYFRLSLVNGASILTDTDAVTLGDVSTHTTGVSAALDMSRAYTDRLTVACKDEVVQGVVVVPFTLKGEGTLYGTMGVNQYTDGVMKIEDKATATLFSDASNTVNIDNFTVRYLTQQAYEDGVYTDGDIVETASISGGDNCYAVVDLAYTVKNDNDGNGFVNVLAYIPGRGVLDVTVEAAPTSRVTEINTTGGIAVSASFAVPPAADEQKSVRLLLRLLPVSGGDAEMDIFLTGDADTALSGTTYFNKSYYTGEPTLEYTISEDGKYYTVTGVLVDELKSVTIPDELGDGLPVTGFTEDIFRGNKSIQYVTIGDGVTHIPQKAFENCTELRSVTMGAGVRSIGADAFRECIRLSASGLFISDFEAWCRVELENEFSSPLRYSSGFFLNGVRITELVIPYGIEHIGNYAFYTYGTGGYITKIVIPNSVKTIGDYAFGGWNQYATLTLSSSLVSIGAHAFDACSTSYMGNGKLTSLAIPNGVIHIGEGAFQGSSALVDLSLPSSLIEIGRDAFAKCNSLKYTESENCYYLGNIRDPYMYLIKAKNTSVVNCVVSATTKMIAYDAFRACESLQSITVDSENTTYASVDGVLYSKDGSQLLQYPRGKADVTFSVPNGVTRIEPYAFYDCTGLRELTVGGTITDVSEYAFYQSSSIVRVTFGSSVSRVGEYAFAECKKLEYVDLGSVRTIGANAFENCTFLKNIDNTESVCELGSLAFSGCSMLLEFSFGEGLTTIPSGLLASCHALERVVIGDYVTSIGQGAFSNCESLRELVIGDGVVSIGKSAFSGCAQLETLTIGRSVTAIDRMAFSDCKALTTVYFNAVNVTELGGKVFRYAGQGAGGIHVVIGSGVTTIPASLFYSEVASGNSSPKETPYVTALTFEQGSVCREIGSYAFYGSRLQTVVLPEGMTHIGFSAFEKSRLSSIVLPKTLTNIDNDAFNGCYLLETITYQGTSAEWAQIEKGGFWYYTSNMKTQVVCTDKAFYVYA